MEWIATRRKQIALELADCDHQAADIMSTIIAENKENAKKYTELQEILKHKE